MGKVLNQNNSPANRRFHTGPPLPLVPPLVPLPDVRRKPLCNGFRTVFLHPQHLVLVRPEKLEKRGPGHASFGFWLLESRRGGFTRHLKGILHNRSFSSGSCIMVTFFFGAALLLAAFENLSKAKRKLPEPHEDRRSFRNLNRGTSAACGRCHWHPLGGSRCTSQLLQLS